MKTKVLLLGICFITSLNVIAQKVTGPSVIGGSTTGQYLLDNTNIPNTYTEWSCSNDLVIVEQNPIRIVVRAANTTVATDGHVVATFKDYYGNVVTKASKNVGVNGPHTLDIMVTVTGSSGTVYQTTPPTVNKGICPSSIYTVTYTSPSLLNTVNWELSMMGDASFISQGNTRMEFRTGANTHGGIVKATATTIYGVRKKILDFTLIESYNCPSSSYYSAYNIPGSNTLKVKFDMNAYEEQENQSKNQTSFDIRLYNITGNLVKKAISRGEDLDIDISNISKGYYVLHIHDGKSNQPYVQNISIQK